MKKLNVPFLPETCVTDLPGKINVSFLHHDPVAINCEPWSLPGVKPQVSFKIAYGIDAIFLRFEVKEKDFRANYSNMNDPVYKDSCVEFFIGFDSPEHYYNFEFNAKGTTYAAYGSPDKRDVLDSALIEQIEVAAEFKKVAGTELPYCWGLTLAIPFSLFSFHSISGLKNMECRANFYKCGDDLPKPHYLCWNPIFADQPDFHLPQYFGQLIFK